MVPVLGLVALAAVGIAVAAQNWSVHLTGDQEVPPPGVVIETQAQGQASFHLSKDGEALRYKLNVANIENVFMAHIHCGPPTTNGPIAVWLYPSTAPVAGPTGQGRIQGRIAAGVITDADVRPLAASATCPGGVSDLEDVLEHISNGNAYVNVHTNDGVAPTNTGAGDFPGGEIRGNLP
ncbi:MAG: CHRD domain-containing protein [Thermoleophilia bacterium]|nr:CHRD domain-containing protein [Thermoleophilia bacterium]